MPVLVIFARGLLFVERASSPLLTLVKNVIFIYFTILKNGQDAHSTRILSFWGTPSIPT
ncbi:hypothetical protein QUB70_21655 [Microcoleus sp. A003_D6]